MQKTIISDTSCLIILEKIGELDILQKLYHQIIITEEISKEFDKDLPNWIIKKEPDNKLYQKILETFLDKGEASAISLALELENCTLIIDDYKARKYAELLGIKITGTLGVIAQAKLSGHLEFVKPLLEKIKNTNFRLNEDLEKKILEITNEFDK